MAVRLTGFTAREYKPAIWPFDVGLVVPKWRYLWKDIASAFAMWEGRGTTLQDIGWNLSDGTLIGGTPWIAGIPGWGLQIAKTSGRGVTVGTDPAPARITVLCYCMRTGTNTDNNYHMASNWQSWGLRRLRSANGGVDTAPTFTPFIGASVADATGPANSLPLNVPVVVVGRWDGSESSVWVDGIKMGSDTSLSGDLDSPGDGYVIGRYVSNSFEFDGDIYETLAINRALDDAEVLGLSLDPFGPFRLADTRRSFLVPTGADSLPYLSGLRKRRFQPQIVR
ncbi:MAG: LamG-like jellyroll fold domain-containing protein [Planctomycetota bacterium]|jgi:hypothetical protein